MHEGAGIDWLGSFAGPITSTGWQDKLHSRVNFETLPASGHSIVVVALYTHVLFRGSIEESMERQLQEAHRFIDKNPGWSLAKSCRQARDLLNSGKRVLLLSIEGASRNLDTPEAIQRWIDREGVSIVTPLHFTNDWIGGPSLLPGVRGLVEPMGWLRAWFHSRGEDDVLRNPRGLTTRGRDLIEVLVQRKVWIDLSHASEAALESIYPILDGAAQPALHTHTMLRRYYPGERGLSEKQIGEVSARNGVIGLIPSEDQMGNARRQNPGCRSGLHISVEAGPAVPLGGNRKRRECPARLPRPFVSGPGERTGRPGAFRPLRRHAPAEARARTGTDPDDHGPRISRSLPEPLRLSIAAPGARTARCQKPEYSLNSP